MCVGGKERYVLAVKREKTQCITKQFKPNQSALDKFIMYLYSMQYTLLV